MATSGNIPTATGWLVLPVGSTMAWEFELIWEARVTIWDAGVASGVVERMMARSSAVKEKKKEKIHCPMLKNTDRQ
jgi:hypothetical protein